MKKLLLSALVAGTMFAGAGAALAEKPAEPGREHGLCTAFFNGQKKGHDKQKAGEGGEYPGPFEDLVDGAPDGPDAGDEGGSVSDLYNYCQQFGIGGNPGENGRFEECFDGDGPDDDSDTCND